MMNLLSLFNAIFVDGSIKESANKASVADLMALAMEGRFVFSREVVGALDALTPGQRGSVFSAFGAELQGLLGQFGKFSPLYRAFPNHVILPFELRWVCFLSRWFGLSVHMNFSEGLYGADPITGFQNDMFGANPDYDRLFSVPLDGTGEKRHLRLVRLADAVFLQNKASAMMNNTTPFSVTEQEFIEGGLADNLFDVSAFATLRFREKLPLIRQHVTAEVYAGLCNSITDVLRLAVHVSGGDVSLNKRTKFKLSTSATKSILGVSEVIMLRGTTDVETDLVRHEEAWKRFASHVRIHKYVDRFPQTAYALSALRGGVLQSWNARYEQSKLQERVVMATDRPGEFVRRLTALLRQVHTERNRTAGEMIVKASAGVFAKVDCLKLLQLYTHLTQTLPMSKRYHMLPDGSIKKSVRVNDGELPVKRVTVVLAGHLTERLAGVLPLANSSALSRMFLPVSNRSMAKADTRNSRGDRVSIDFTDSDVVRLFLYWKKACDVDLSVTFFDSKLERLDDCSYMNLAVYKGYAQHSGDILDGRKGAAEYVDIDVGKAKANDVHYALVTVFPCFTGVMVRDGVTGQHFEIDTVQSKLSIDSESRMNTPALFNLYTGELIFADLSGDWNMYANVRNMSASINDTLDLLLNYGSYRTSYHTVFGFAGTPTGEVATMDIIRDNRDDILLKLSTAPAVAGA